jgi:xylulose-5-phosphate/fructose-6-phosphate phosphoketolase
MHRHRFRYPAVRFHPVTDVIDRVPRLGYLAADAKQEMRDKLIEHKQYIARYGDDMADLKQWRWAGGQRLSRAVGE